MRTVARVSPARPNPNVQNAPLTPAFAAHAMSVQLSPTIQSCADSR